jgi:hypothetical protein
VAFYIHIEDPGFPEAPWPGERRLGPFVTEEEALNQAVSDAALGFGLAVGVYSEAESERRREASHVDAGMGLAAATRGEPIGSHGGKSTHTRSAIARKADVLSRRLAKERAATLSADAEAISTAVDLDRFLREAP